MALTDAERLRQMLGESIPPGGQDSDTLFQEREIEDFLERSPDNLNGAAYLGWEAKAAIFAGMANIQEGTSRESLSDLHAQAQKRVEHFGKISGLLPGLSRNVRIGKVVRP